MTDLSLIDKILLSKESKSLIDKGENIKSIYIENFENKLIFFKIFFIVLFICMAINYRYVSFIKNNPITFSFETILYGIAGAIPFLYMEKFRKPKRDSKYLLLFITMFLLYCLFNILFEIGGTYYYLYENQESNSNKKSEVLNNEDKFINNTKNSILITLGLLFLIIIISMIIISFKVNYFKIEAYADNIILNFALETLIFSLFNSLPFLLIAYNREGKNFNLKKNAEEVVLIFIKFLILHIMLQTSGFYESTFNY